MRHLRVGFVGDSITHGTGDETLLGWTIRLGQAERPNGTDIVVYNLGVRADTSALAAARWEAEAAARLSPSFPTATVFAIGINDTAVDNMSGLGGNRVPLEESLDTVKGMLQAAERFGPTCWVGPTPVVEDMMPVAPVPALSFSFDNATIETYSKAYGAMAAEMGVDYLDLYAKLAENAAFLDSLRQTDGLHPSASGYEIMADTIGQWSGWRRIVDAGA